MTAPVDAGLVVQGTGGGLRKVLDRRHLLAMLVRKELRVRYRASVLGLGWSYVKPAVQFVVYFVALGLVLRQNAIGDYAVYLFGGLVVVTFLSEALGNATRSVVANGELVRKIFLPRELFPVSSVCVAAVCVSYGPPRTRSRQVCPPSKVRTRAPASIATNTRPATLTSVSIHRT